MILNETLDWANVDAAVRKTFAKGESEKRCLDLHHQLFKFTQFNLGHGGRVTPWWSSVQPLTPTDTGLETLLTRANRRGAQPNEFARVRSAVTKEWNAMTDLQIVQLRLPVWGFLGVTAHQPIDQEKSSENVVFIGGAVQVWIPNLTLSHVRLVSWRNPGARRS